jgi:L-iditol 2-dehydrogenase
MKLLELWRWLAAGFLVLELAIESLSTRLSSAATASFCLRGQVNLCDRREVIGVSTPAYRRMGAFAEYVAVPERTAYHLPDNLPFAHAALIEAVSVAVHAVSLTPLAIEDTVVIVGAGMIGLLTLQAAMLAGAGSVFVFDVDDTRLDLARSLGATHTFNSGNGSTPRSV